MFQGESAYISHNAPLGAAYEDVVGALEGLCGDYGWRRPIIPLQSSHLAQRRVTSKIFSSRPTIGPVGPCRVSCEVRPEGAGGEVKDR
jgi:hypothetical protein